MQLFKVPVDRFGGDSTTALFSNALMAASFGLTWLWPSWLASRQVQYLTFVVLIEIIMVMMMFFLVPLLAINFGGTPRKIAIGFVLGFFGLFIAVLSIVEGEYLFVLFVAYTLFNKTLSVKKLNPILDIKWSFIADWAASVAILFITSIISFALPMPELGLNPDTLYYESNNTLNIDVSYGDFEKEPQSAMAFGVVYYSLQAFAQKMKYKYFKKRILQ